MSYTKHNVKSGDVISPATTNSQDDQILLNEANIMNLQQIVEALAERIPVPPTTAGTYKLEAEVENDGSVSYTWLAETEVEPGTDPADPETPGGDNTDPTVDPDTGT